MITVIISPTPTLPLMLTQPTATPTSLVGSALQAWPIRSTPCTMRSCFRPGRGSAKPEVLSWVRCARYAAASTHRTRRDVSSLEGNGMCVGRRPLSLALPGLALIVLGCLSVVVSYFLLPLTVSDCF